MANKLVGFQSSRRHFPQHTVRNDENTRLIHVGLRTQCYKYPAVKNNQTGKDRPPFREPV